MAKTMLKFSSRFGILSKTKDILADEKITVSDVLECST